MKLKKKNDSSSLVPLMNVEAIYRHSINVNYVNYILVLIALKSSDIIKMIHIHVIQIIWQVPKKFAKLVNHALIVVSEYKKLADAIKCTVLNVKLHLVGIRVK